MRAYPVLCACGLTAAFKVASRWSDGYTCELKTYALVCAGCLPAALAQAREKHAACRLTLGETLDPPTAVERPGPPAGGATG